MSVTCSRNILTDINNKKSFNTLCVDHTLYILGQEAVIQPKFLEETIPDQEGFQAHWSQITMRWKEPKCSIMAMAVPPIPQGASDCADSLPSL